MSQRLEPRDDVLDHSMHAVRRKAEAERDDLGQLEVVRAFEEEAEEAPHPRADEEGVVSSEEIELEEEVVRREDGGDGGDPVHFEALLMEEELEARHLVHIKRVDFGFDVSGGSPITQANALPAASAPHGTS